MKTEALALIEVEILLCRGSAQKIGTDSRKQLLKIITIPLNIQLKFLKKGTLEFSIKIL